MNQTTEFLISHGGLFLFLLVLVEQSGLPLPAAPFQPASKAGAKAYDTLKTRIRQATQ